MTKPFLVFDAYGTLLHLDDFVGRLRRAFAARGEHIPVDVLRKSAMLEMLHYADHALFAHDEASMRRLHEECSAVLLRAITERGFRSRLQPGEVVLVLKESVAFTPFPEVPATLAELRTRGIAMAVASNWDYLLPEVLAEHRLNDFFAWTQCSAACGVQKPSPRFFEIAMEAALEAGGEPGAIWYIGDHYEKDVLASRQAGFTPVWLVRGERDAVSGTAAAIDHSIRQVRALSDLLKMF